MARTKPARQASARRVTSAKQASAARTQRASARKSARKVPLREKSRRVKSGRVKSKRRIVVRSSEAGRQNLRRQERTGRKVMKDAVNQGVSEADLEKGRPKDTGRFGA